MTIPHTEVVLCDIHDVPLFEYLRDVFAELAGKWPQSKISELLPSVWEQKHWSVPATD